ncbi:hypothetical protein CLOBY_27420 [Clostridium saccharobutylicum]|uniref:hypothetical protein n=1 Tax=Clostridium saccharobutylicum TaxID=169679 RepID=UPI000983BDD6|nr:hypothetical protein [Clostridium saccharobutylicum]AQS10597.1 hypothetical protein CLOBY_27420 [Clostridium saccharobutylicum]MBC2438050.1 hypothetical protein [Clostridium saccharobutylicum]NSB90497.1 hypothetical protein [Clostridium saccharobutylicum]NYC31552.1 hypothetical protein [Clostridium saccharobutylicum]OOM18870.1 hypothetical protein CLSAB_03280 [Clostridium saccharobutylicum]
MSKKLNIIEAMKMPIGTEFEVKPSIGNCSCPNLFLKDGKGEGVLVSVFGHSIIATQSILEATFIPIEKPVSFMEAVAKAKTNRFRIEHELLPKTKLGHTLRSTIYTLINHLDLSNDEIVDVILNSKCYIEESEADSDE